MLPCAETALICKFKEQLPYMNNYDLIIVGAGPAGIFTALELLRKSSKTTGPRICLIEKGKPVEKRHCPKDKTGHCVNCKPTCAITTGFSGAGAFSDGKRTWAKELAHSNVRPTLKDAVAGDITAAMPYRAMVSIIEFIKMVDHVAPGFAAPETLLYSPELKFYSNKVKMDTDLETNISGLHCLGDSSGWTRGLMMASVMGVLMGRKLIENHDM